MFLCADIGQAVSQYHAFSKARLAGKRQKAESEEEWRAERMMGDDGSKGYRKV